jgi:hypothetical protein
LPKISVEDPLALSLSLSRIQALGINPISKLTESHSRDANHNLHTRDRHENRLDAALHQPLIPVIVSRLFRLCS